MSILYSRHPTERDLALFAGGELGPLARWRIEGHLEDCSRCREAVSEFFELRSQLMDLGDLPHVDWSAFSDRIRREVERSRTASRPTPVWRPVWAAAGVFAILLAGGVYVARHELAPAGPVLGVSARGVELRVGSEPSLTLVQAPGLVEAGGASARSFDEETGAITVTHVYAQ